MHVQDVGLRKSLQLNPVNLSHVSGGRIAVAELKKIGKRRLTLYLLRILRVSTLAATLLAAGCQSVQKPVSSDKIIRKANQPASATDIRVDAQGVIKKAGQSESTAETRVDVQGVRLSDLVLKPKAAPSAAELPADVRARLEAGNAAWDDGNLDAAAQEYLAIINSYGEAPATFQARYHLGTIAYHQQNPATAVQWLGSLTRLDPGKFHPNLSFMLLDSLHELDQRPEIKNEIGRMTRNWRRLGDRVRQAERSFVREVFVVGDQRVAAVQAHLPRPPYRRRLLFSIVDKNTEKVSSAKEITAISLGSFVSTEAYIQKSEGLAPGDRIFHLDYYECSIHRTLGYFKDEPPDYWTIKSLAIDYLQGKFKEISSTKSPKACGFANFLSM